MPSAPACVDMCQPSATTAIEPNSVPPTISATIIAAVSATTNQVRRSCLSCLAPRKTWPCCQGSIEWVCMGNSCNWRPVNT